jgi:hypothetical protein
MSSRETLPDHLIPLPDSSTGRWALWRTVCVRGAGFPASDVLQIADPACAAAADRLAAVEEETETLRQAAQGALHGELRAAGRERLNALARAVGHVKRGRPVATEGLDAATAAAVDTWKASAERLAVEKAHYQAAFAEADERLDRVLREVAQNERFREAITWQNPHAAETGLGSFLRRSAEGVRDSSRSHRRHKQMLASYLQRYCTKNDTIGFFGPVGLALLGEGSDVATARCGPELLAARQVYFEGWAIDAIADRLGEDEAMRPWLAPRLSPFLRREGDAYIGPGGEKLQLGPLSGALLAACDGTRPAGALIRGLGADLPDDKKAILWGLLADLHAKGVIRWSFQIPLSLTPERILRDLLLAIEEFPLGEGPGGSAWRAAGRLSQRRPAAAGAARVRRAGPGLAEGALPQPGPADRRAESGGVPAGRLPGRPRRDPRRRQQPGPLRLLLAAPAPGGAAGCH